MAHLTPTLLKYLDMMSAITAGININWLDVLFDILTAMVSTPDKQHMGFAVQISELLEQLRVPLSSSTALHYLKIRS